MRTVLFLTVLAGCVRSDAVQCSDGQLCAPGTVCIAGGCAAPGQCGDSHLDPLEQCDDGNRIAGDGCSSTCKLEHCGDGVLDSGEECDDANAMSHDGCSSGCRIEHPAWTQVLGAGPTLRRGHVMAWDPDHGNGILHGGTGNVVTGDTWIWDGAWTRAADGPARTFHVLAWDGAGHLIQYGGFDDAGMAHDESYAWDGSAWTLLAGTSAGHRYDHAMARNVVAGEVVEHGGLAFPGGLESSTWIRRAGGWTIAVANPMPPLESRNRLTFDPIRGVVLAAGGSPSGHRTYLWDGTSWMQHGMGLQLEDPVQDYDPARRTIVAFSGNDPNPSNGVSEWNGAVWTTLEIVGAIPPVRFRSAGFYDPIRHELVAFGGNLAGPDFGDDTWVLRWDSATVDDACDGTTDLDGDGFVGCADPDCWARCTPRCPPGVTCGPSEPRCGDGVCNPSLETSDLCPSDC